jgi:hypothetical protein
METIFYPVTIILKCLLKGSTGFSLFFFLIIGHIDEDGYGALMERYRHAATQVLRENHVPVPLCPPQILNGLVPDKTRAFAVRSRHLTV